MKYYLDEIQIPQEAKNIQAFLDMISYAEGTDRYGDERGYNVLVGGGLFHSYEDHPNILVDLPRYGIKSTAAGRYQILYRFWTHYKKQLDLPDFSPPCQDAYAIQQFKERKPNGDIKAGGVDKAFKKCSNIWVSFPGPGNGHEEVEWKKLEDFCNREEGRQESHNGNKEW